MFSTLSLRNPIGLVLLATTFLLAGCGRSDAAPPVAEEKGAALAYFAGGCFWGVEHFLETIDGVHSVQSGYMGGRTERPTYKQISYTDTGHAETVRVSYDPKKVTYRALAKRFFEIHDPTQVDRQGPDRGKQYRSAIFTLTADETKAVSDLVGLLTTRGYRVATEVKQVDPTVKFWTAEEYHQNYYARTKKEPYCHTPVPRFDRDAK
jgi:peptide methionine sulfoxide reductase msrA/msrB